MIQDDDTAIRCVSCGSVLCQSDAVDDVTLHQRIQQHQAECLHVPAQRSTDQP
jgi:hypothetical protein